MSEKVAIVTGGASGIGLAVCESLAQAGFCVVVADINDADGQALASKIKGLFIHTDLAQSADCQVLVDQTIASYGRIDVLVNNGGFQHVSPIKDFPEDKWNALIAVMLTAPFLLTKAAWPHMEKQAWGRIVNIASVHSQVASLYKAAYISAKHGLIGLTKTTALEGGEVGITANAISPAYVRTPLVDKQIAAQAKNLGISEEDVISKVMMKNAAIKRLIEPEEIAEMVLYLCSDKAQCVTGSNWNIDTGWTAQ
ncbi:MAG: 3-hydroxybutyrate dehydrogenase [Arenicellales bacterium]